MMYINIKKLYSWRIRPYKIPSFFFPLLFPFFSFFLSFLLPPFFLSSPLMVCECAPAHPLRSPGEFTDSLLLRTRVVCSKNFTVLLALTDIYSPPRDLYSHSWCLFFENNSEVSSEMCSYGLRKFNVRKDLHLINVRLKMGFYTAKVFSAVRIEDEDS